MKVLLNFTQGVVFILLNFICFIVSSLSVLNSLTMFIIFLLNSLPWGYHLRRFLQDWWSSGETHCLGLSYYLWIFLIVTWHEDLVNCLCVSYEVLSCLYWVEIWFCFCFAVATAIRQLTIKGIQIVSEDITVSLFAGDFIYWGI